MCTHIFLSDMMNFSTPFKAPVHMLFYLRGSQSTLKGKGCTSVILGNRFPGQWGVVIHLMRSSNDSALDSDCVTCSAIVCNRVSSANLPVAATPSGEEKNLSFLHYAFHNIPHPYILPALCFYADPTCATS